MGGMVMYPLQNCKGKPESPAQGCSEGFRGSGCSWPVLQGLELFSLYLFHQSQVPWRCCMDTLISASLF